MLISSIKNRDIIFFIALGLYLLAKDIEISAVYYTVHWMPIVLKLLRYASYAMIICISIFLTKYSKKTLIRYAVFMMLFLIVSVTAGSVTILFNFAFIFAAKDIPFSKVLRFVISIQAIVSVCIVLGCTTGLIEDWTYLRSAGHIRHSLGYGYPNALPTIFFYLMLAVCYLMRDRFRLWHLIGAEVVNYIIFYYTNARAGFGLTAVALVVLWALRYVSKPLKSSHISRLLYVHSIYLIAIFAIVVCYFYTPDIPLLRTADEVLSGRLGYAHNALHTYKLTLFGQSIPWHGWGGYGYTTNTLPEEYNYVDCAYIKILLDNGILMLLAAILGYMLAANEELKKGNRYFCAALLFANIYALIEPRYIETGFNPFVWALSSLILYEFWLETGGDRIHFGTRSLSNGDEDSGDYLLNGIIERFK